MLDIIYLGLYNLIWFLLWILPDSFIRLMMKGLAWFAYSFSSRRRNIIHKNLDLAFDPPLNEKEKKDIGIHAFMNLIDTVFGIIRRDGMSKSEVLKNVNFKGEEIVQKYKDDGKKIIFVTGHQGNWELLSQSIAIKFDLTLVGVGRKMDSEVMDKVLKKNRERFNVEMVYKKGATKGCIKALSQNKSIGILVDQSIDKSQSIDVTFFGHQVTHSPLASILSRKFGIALIPAFIHTDNYIDYHVKIYDPLECIKTDNQESDLISLTQAQANIMEKVIKEHPKQWFWMHKRWKEYYSYK